MNEHFEALKYVGDAISLGTIISYFAGALPAVATILTIIWTGLRIYEMCTVQGWLGKKKKKNNGQDATS